MPPIFAKALAITAVLIATASLNVTSASAQIAQETLNTCGANVESNVANGNEARNFTSTSFTRLFSAKFNAASGTVADCAVVTFSAEALCAGASARDLCFVRALDNGVEMLPAAGGSQILTSESNTPAGHSYTFVSRGPLKGTHVYTIEARVGAAGTTLSIDDWTIFVQLFS